MSPIGLKRSLTFLLLGLISAVMTLSCQENKRADGLYAELTTDKGTIMLELYPERTPLTVSNFIGLAQGNLDFANKKGPFYDGLTFHRVIEDFMIQGGDPQATGSGGPGYQFADELDPELLFDSPGILAMANAGPGTNGSQFFITHVATPWLQGKHSIFGRVIEGQDVVDSIAQGDILKKVEIHRIGEKAKKFKVDSTIFRNLEKSIQSKEKQVLEEKEKEMKAEIAHRWPQATLDEKTGIYSSLQTEGIGAPPVIGNKISVHYTGTFINGETFDSSRDRNEPFQFNVGQGQVIPGWDKVLLQMKKGERRTIILPPEMAYGERGVGPIQPNSWLVFDVELLDF